MLVSGSVSFFIDQTLGQLEDEGRLTDVPGEFVRTCNKWGFSRQQPLYVVNCFGNFTFLMFLFVFCWGVVVLRHCQKL